MGGMGTRGRSRHRARGLAPHAKVPPAPSRHLHAELAATIRGLPNVVGTYLGHKTRKGRSLGAPALVVLVDSKVASKQLSPAHRIPRTVSLQVSPKVKVTLPTDVIVREKFVRASVASPGDGVSAGQGTVGAAIFHPDLGNVVTTAGHVYSHLFPIRQEWEMADAPVVSLRDRESGDQIVGQLRKLVVDANADYALISPTTVTSRNVYDDSLLGGPYSPDSNDVGQPCSVLESDKSYATYFRGVSCPLEFDDGSRIEHAILTDVCTSGGDSGCCLVDANRRIVGLLVGHNSKHSAFMPITRILIDENASLI